MAEITVRKTHRDSKGLKYVLSLSSLLHFLAILVIYITAFLPHVPWHFAYPLPLHLLHSLPRGSPPSTFPPHMCVCRHMSMSTSTYMCRYAKHTDLDLDSYLKENPESPSR